MQRFKKEHIFFVIDGGIGDLVIVMVVIDEMKRLNPDARITFSMRHSSYRSVVELNPNIDDIVSYPFSVDGDLKSFKMQKMELEKKYDQVILFTPPGVKDRCKWRLKIKRWMQKRGWNPDRRHLVERFADIAGIKIENKKPKFYFDHEDQSIADQFLKENGLSQNDLVIFIAHRTGGSRFLRNWPIKNFEQLVTQIKADTDCKVIVSGSKNDPILNVDSVIHAMGFPLRPTACLIKRSNLFIGMDSGLTHIASCFDCDIVSIHAGYPVFETGALSDSISFVHTKPFKKAELISVEQVYEVVRNRISRILDGGFNARVR